MKEEGEDLTIVSYSVMVGKCLEAVRELEEMEISAEVIDLKTVAPLDIDTVVESVKKTGRLLIVHEAYKKGGIGAEIASLVNEKAFDYLDTSIMRVGAQESPIPFAESLENVIIPGVDDIKEKCMELMAD